MNTNFTKNPIVGTPLTPSVIKQIHTAVRRYMPIAGNGIRTSVTAGGTIISAIPAPAPKKKKQTDKPLPFEVRYDGTIDSGAGGWKIYLPTEHLVQFDGTYLDPLNGVTPILDANGDETGWYSFDEITLQDDHVWLVVTVTESNGSVVSVDAEFAAEEGQAASDEKVANICIAEVSYEAATQSTPETIDIKQSVVGAIIFGGGGSEITASGTVVSSVDYVTSSGDPDYASHAYAIRIKRGTLTYNAQTGALSIVENNNLKQFIDTVPHSTSMDS